MKIHYEKTVPITPSISNVRPGELFRIPQGEKVYMRTSARACDEFTSGKDTALRKMFVTVDGYAFEDVDYEDLVFCTDIDSGKLVIFPMTLEVEKLLGELMIKERWADVYV